MAILTVTFNPAIDKSTTVWQIEPDKKLRCSPPVFEPGGGGINVARALKNLGINAKALYFFGSYSGRFLNDLLNALQIDISPVEINGPTRENLIVYDQSSDKQYRFNMPGPQIQISEWQQLLTQIDQLENIDFIVASGSLSPGVPADIFARISDMAKRKNIRMILDSSGEPLKLGVEQGVFLLKPNLGELCMLAGVENLKDEMIENAARDLIIAGKCEIVVISLGEAGALLVTQNLVKHIAPPKVKVKSTVGAGDSMVAGIVFALSKGGTIEDAVTYGVACGTAATMNAGTALCKKMDADQLFSGMKMSSKIFQH